MHVALDIDAEFVSKPCQIEFLFRLEFARRGDSNALQAPHKPIGVRRGVCASEQE